MLSRLPCTTSFLAALWRSFASVDPMKLVDLPVGGEARFDISHGGKLLSAEAEIELGSGRIFAPFDEKHPAAIDGGILKVAYDGGKRRDPDQTLRASLG